MEGTILELAARLNLRRRTLETIIASHGIPVVGHRKTHNGGFRGGVSRLYRLGDILEKLGRKPPPLPPAEALPPKVSISDVASFFRLSYQSVYIRVVAARLSEVDHRIVRKTALGRKCRECLYDRDSVVKVLGKTPTVLRTKTAAPDGFEYWYEGMFGRPPLAGVDYSRADRKKEDQ